MKSTACFWHAAIMCPRDGPPSVTTTQPSVDARSPHLGDGRTCTRALAPRAPPPCAAHTTHSPRAEEADAVRPQRGLRPVPRAAQQRPGHRAVLKEEGPQEKPPHLGPLHDAVQAEVVGTALWCPHGLVPESIQTNGAALGIVIRVKCSAGLQAPLRTCHYFHVVIIVFRIFRTLKKGKHCTCVK